MPSMSKVAGQIIKFVPPALLFLFICLNAYFYIITQAKSYLQGPIYLSVFIVFWAYFQCLKTHPGKVPPYFDFIEDSYKKKVLHSDYKTDLRGAYATFCEKCLKGRPGRTHHCSTCGTCILKRDHHCMWINNCVGLNNHKHFIHLLYYGAVCCCMISIELGTLMLKNYEQVSISDFYGFILNFSTCVGLSFMSIYHLWLIFTNRTMFDLRWSIKKSPYDLGLLCNIESQLGKALISYILPLNPNLSGIFYPMRLETSSGEVVELERSVLIVNKD